MTACRRREAPSRYPGAPQRRCTSTSTGASTPRPRARAPWASLLLPSGNTIEVVSKGSNLDDLLITNVRIESFAPYAELPEATETDVHHLGDSSQSEGQWALAPDPEGTSWTSDPFAAPGFDTATSVRIRVDLMNSEFANPVLLNGVQVGILPDVGNGISDWTDDQQILGIDPGLLLPAGNRIEVEAAAGGSNHDDFLFRNLRLEIAPESDVPPGGYSDNTGMHEFVIHVVP